MSDNKGVACMRMGCRDRYELVVGVVKGAAPSSSEQFSLSVSYMQEQVRR